MSSFSSIPLTLLGFRPPQAAGISTRAVFVGVFFMRPASIAVSSPLCPQRWGGHFAPHQAPPLTGFRGMSFPRVKAVTRLGRGALPLERRSLSSPRHAAMESTSSGFGQNLFFSGANVSRWAVRSLRIRRALARAECQYGMNPQTALDAPRWFWWEGHEDQGRAGHRRRACRRVGGARPSRGGRSRNRRLRLRTGALASAGRRLYRGQRWPRRWMRFGLLEVSYDQEQ